MTRRIGQLVVNLRGFSCKCLFTAALFPVLVAQGQDRAIRKQVVVDASLKEVWEAFTTSEGAQTFFAPQARIAPTLGGLYKIIFYPERPRGKRGCEEECRIQSIVPMKSLAFTWGQEQSTKTLREAGLTTIVYLDFKELSPRRTLVHFTNIGWGEGEEWDQSYKFSNIAWDYVFGNLKVRFAKGPIDWANPPAPTESFSVDSAQEKQFLYRLVATRTEMLTKGPTAAEAAAIGEHFERLGSLMREGVVILAGRTLNNDESTFGIVIFRAESEAVAREIMNDDPTVKKKVMRGELFPYRVALLEGKPID